MFLFFVQDTSVVFPALPILTVIALTVIIAKKSEPAGNMYQLYPCLYLISFGFVFAKVTCKLIVSDLTLSYGLSTFVYIERY